MPNPVIYLPTEMLYQKPDFTAHNGAMKIFLQSQFGETYFDKESSVKTKWDQLMGAFKNKVPEEYKELFQTFQEKRKQVASGNRFNLSLEDALVLFENFYFLYNGDNAKFCISKSTQPKFLEELKRAMGPAICEPGIATEFNTQLRKYRSDTNWILVELHEARSNIIQRIADEYNAINRVSAAMSIHTVMHMVTLAQKKSLGVDNEKKVDDVYALHHQTESMTQYFESVYEEYFTEYELNLKRNLAEYALLTLRTNVLAGIDLSQWDNKALVLTQEQTNIIYPKLGEFFGLHFTVDERQCIVEYEGTLSILKKSDVLDKLQELIEKKLEKEKLLVNFNNLNKENVYGYNLRLPTGVSGEMLCTLNEKLQNAKDKPQQVRRVLTSNLKLIEKYSSLICKALLANPGLLFYLPKTLRNDSHFFDSVMSTIDLVSDESDSRIELLLIMIKPNPDVLRGYSSSSFLNNKKIALKILAKNGLIYKYLSSELQVDKQVMECASNQNPKVTQYFPANNTSVLNDRMAKLQNEGLELNENWSNISLLEKMDKAQSFLRLLQTEVVSIPTFTQLAQLLSPSELLWIIKARQQKGLQNLPELTEEGLKQFINALELTEKGWGSNYLNFKRRTTKVSQFLEQNFSITAKYNRDLANRCVTHSNQWLTAFFAFQKQIPLYYKPFLGLEDVLDQLKLTGRISLSLLKSIASFLVVLVEMGINYGITLLPPLIDLYLTPYCALIINSIAAYTGGALFLCLLQLYLGSVLFYNLYSDRDYGSYILLFINATLFFSMIALPTFFLTFIFTLELVYLACCLLAGLIAASNSAFGRSWTAPEINTLVFSLLYRWYSADLFYFLSGLNAVMHFVLKLIDEWPNLLFAMIAPWVTRSIATGCSSASTPTEEDLLKVKVENSISRLLESDSVSANLKGNMLDFLWQKIQLDVEESNGTLTLQKALNRKYTLPTDGEECERSFMEVADTHRSDHEGFNLNTTQTRYSFFCIKSKTTTASNLQEYVENTLDAQSP